MIVLGGFAGHGFKLGITVSTATLQRVCNDCGYSWSPDADALTRTHRPCAYAEAMDWLAGREQPSACRAPGEDATATDAPRPADKRGRALS